MYVFTYHHTTLGELVIFFSKSKQATQLAPRTPLVMLSLIVAVEGLVVDLVVSHGPPGHQGCPNQSLLAAAPDPLDAKPLVAMGEGPLDGTPLAGGEGLLDGIHQPV